MKKHKTGIKFTLMMLASLLVGAVLGLGAVQGAGVLQIGWAAAQLFLQQQALWLMLAASLLLLGATLIFLRYGKRWADRFLADESGEDESAFEKADFWLSLAIAVSGMVQVTGLILFAVGCSDFLSLPPWKIFGMAAVLLAGCFLTIALQARLVGQAKRLYPEKRGSVLDNRFQKEWFQSCDEAERQQIGQAAYCALQATGRAGLILLLLLVLLGVVMPVGVLPALSVGAMWMTQTVSYQLAAAKIGKGKNGPGAKRRGDLE